MSDARIETVAVGNAQLTCAWWGSGPTRVVMLHDGLGSIGQWRDVPGRIAERLGVGVMAYDRPGHGSSTPTPDGPWPADWLSTEAGRLGDLLGVLGIERPLLVGHSDGGSISLIHAAAGGAASGVVALAPHSWVEDVCRANIAAMRENPQPILWGLARHHEHPEAVFEAWSGVWVSDEFSRWDVRPQLGEIDVPTLVVQGVDDAYATDAQLHLTVEAVGGQGAGRLVPDVGHLLHHDDPDLVVDVVADFFAGV